MDAQTGTYYIFNPETDMAMASGRECYTAPLSVRKFAANLALLPALYAPEGSIILTDYDISPDTPYIGDGPLPFAKPCIGREYRIDSFHWSLK